MSDDRESVGMAGEQWPFGAPIVVLGVSCSGTKLLSEIIGSHSSVKLFTEHKPERIYSGANVARIRDHELWRQYFSFPGGRRLLRSVPVCEELFAIDDTAVTKMRDQYETFAKGYRIAVKNPQNIARLDVVRRIFPEGVYIFAARHPFGILQSAYRGAIQTRTWYGYWRRRPYLRTKECLDSIPQRDILARISHGIGKMAAAFDAMPDVPRIIVRYEDITTNTQPSIDDLYGDLFGEKPPIDVYALPQSNVRDTSKVKKLLSASPRSGDAFRWIDHYARTFGYDVNR